LKSELGVWQTMGDGVGDSWKELVGWAPYEFWCCRGAGRKGRGAGDGPPPEP